jgi:hypothetical protein
MAGHGTAGSGRMRSGWPHNHGSYLPRGGLCDAGEPGTRQARSRRLGAPAEGRSSRSAPAGTGAEQVWCGVTAGPGPGAARRAGPRSGTASGEPGRGRAGPARDLAVNQVSARRAGPVTRLPPARPRPAAMCHPVAVVRMAGMIIVVVPADPAACPALPRQASIERRIAESPRKLNSRPGGILACRLPGSVCAFCGALCRGRLSILAPGVLPWAGLARLGNLSSLRLSPLHRGGW